MNHHHHHNHSDSHHHGPATAGGHIHDSAREGNKKGLTIALIITGLVMILEFVGGLVTNSLALLSDSGHMLSDFSSLLLSLAAIWFATRQAPADKTYGFYRFEVLAALFNGVSLFVIAGFIVWEAYQRFLEPPQVAGGSMLIIVAIGLAANLLSAWALMRRGDVKNNLNLRSAYLHVLGDALGSVGAIIAGVVMLLFSWYAADPLISVIVALLILKSAWGVIKHSLHILMEGAPAYASPDKVEEELMQIAEVVGVHDLHLWTITSGMDALSCHLVITDLADGQEVLQEAIRRVQERFGIDHATIQIEESTIRHPVLKI
ncbi:cation diffusion facilitator family transporter [Paenibacillus sp. J2TS4]|uniref:cation diffusion facilitator family transporter n=1 Tax=Paenibacillus sp. J2TS4 TaxID=2807194 RepID=UPI001B1BB3E0|nr:cation diffusion facilitator family transporter [Paenibacillus sp. J2TS4]GIP31320.1 cation transporter [Paenibacillus sp. J2TS4]